MKCAATVTKTKVAKLRAKLKTIGTADAHATMTLPLE